MTKIDMERRYVTETGPARDIAELVEPIIEELGFRLVRVKISARDGATLQIMADRAMGHVKGHINIDDCATISRELSPVLDAEDPISGPYHLEVSTPGIDRPLVRPRDFEDWAGYEARVTLNEMVDGRKRFRGLLEGFEDGEVRLKVRLEAWDAPRVLGFPITMIEQAKLMMTDDLLKAARDQAAP